MDTYDLLDAKLRQYTDPGVQDFLRTEVPLGEISADVLRPAVLDVGRIVEWGDDSGIVVLLSVSLVLCGIPLRASAQDEGDIAPDVSAEAQLTIGEQGGYLYGSRDVLGKLYEEHQFSSKKGGHSFAAEQANTFLDRARGLDAKVIGYDNAKKRCRSDDSVQGWNNHLCSRQILLNS